LIRLWAVLSILWIMGMGIYFMPDAIKSFKTALKAEQEIKVLKTKLQELQARLPTEKKRTYHEGQLSKSGKYIMRGGEWVAIQQPTAPIQSSKEKTFFALDSQGNRIAIWDGTKWIETKKYPEGTVSPGGKYIVRDGKWVRIESEEEEEIRSLEFKIGALQVDVKGKEKLYRSLILTFLPPIGIFLIAEALYRVINWIFRGFIAEGTS
jgi:hypothetical protein